MSGETTVIYNADCPVCAREIAHYRAYSDAQGLAIRYAGLEQADRWGLTPDRAARRLHVIRDGRLFAGVEAFIVLWQAMPRFRWLARLVALPGLRQAAGLLYDGVLAPVLYALHRRRVRRQGAACS